MCRCGGRCSSCYARAYGQRRPARALAGFRPLGSLVLGLGEIPQLFAVLGIKSWGDRIGRFPPAGAHGGRTIGVPCSGILGGCTRADMQAWYGPAKAWTRDAGKLRDEIVVKQYGGDPSKWPEKAVLAEKALNSARNLLAGPQGQEPATLAQVQFLAIAAFELFLQAMEAVHGIPEIDITGTVLDHDQLVDPENRPHWQPLPELPKLSDYVPSLGGISLVLIAAVALFLMMRSRK